MKPIVLFDGNCALCRRTIKVLSFLDIFRQLKFINALSSDAAGIIQERDLKLEDLLYDMHIVEGASSWKGYEAYQRISLRIPLLWLLVPFLYFPPVRNVGERVYRRVADSRTCKIEPVKAPANSHFPWWIKASVARFKRTGIILMYHRINDSPLDPWRLNVSPKNFDEQIQIIKKYGKTVQMRDMGQDLSSFNPWKDEIALTFDDGISDNFHMAKPVLEKHEVPATFYIPSHAMEGQQEFWWDKLSRVLTAGDLPKIFQMTINNTRYQWQIDPDSADQSQLTDELPAFNSVLSRKQLLLFTWRMIRSLSFQAQDELVERISVWSGQSSSPSAYLPMTLKELNVMADSKLFEIGAHTAHHPWLSAWPVKGQEEDIRTGKEKLEEWINKKVVSFAYPFGNYSAETPGILERLAFQNACTVAEAPVKRNMNRFLLPRFMVFNWNGDKFEEKLQEWLTQGI